MERIKIKKSLMVFVVTDPKMPEKKSGKKSKEKGKCQGTRIVKAMLILLFPFTLSLSTILAQETIPATGVNASGSGGSVSYSVGQVVYCFNTGTNGSVTQGIQQPYEILVISEIEEATGINLVCLAYPNPVTNLLTLTVESKNNFSLSTLTFYLYDINGMLIESKKIESNKTIIQMEHLSPSTYFMKVSDNNNEIKIFKIIKN